MRKPKGLMLAAMQPQASFEEEFNDWYDTDHLPERASTEGFLSARRYVCLDGWPRYLALYDLETVDAVHSAAYKAFTGENLSPWSRRVLKRVLGEFRIEGTLVYPQDAISLPPKNLARLVLLRFSGVGSDRGGQVVSMLRARFEHRPEVAQLRVFRDEDSQGEDHLGVLELRAPLKDLDMDPGPFSITLCNVYTLYSRKTL